MLALAAPICLVLVLLFCKWRAGQVEEWVRQQVNIASFRYAGNPGLEERLRLRAADNSRLKRAFGIDNSLTTESRTTHMAFLGAAKRLLNRNDRSWAELYSIAETFLNNEVRFALQHRQGNLHLAESVRCMVLAVVLFDSFGLSPSTVPRSTLVTITEEINNQWLRSKCNPDDLAPSALLNSAIASLDINSRPPSSEPMTPAEVLSLLMPQYETLWRVVLLTFATAYHHQPAALPDVVRRTADVPSCLGDPTREKEALKLAKEGLRLYPSNKHLYRAVPSPNNCNNPSASSQTGLRGTIATDISRLHRHPSIWGRDALTFRPSRFDNDKITPLQREAYIPFSVKPHKCPAAGNAFGERMVVVLVVALGRVLGPESGRVCFGENGGCGNMNGKGAKGLATGRGEMEGWVWEVRM